jgi:hypothetical protein
MPDDDTTGADGEQADENGEMVGGSDLPVAVVDEVERLTRLAREAVDDEEAAVYRRERASLLAEYGYTARVREDDSRDVLVCYPDKWLDDGLVQPDRIDDLDRGIERPLSGPGGADEWHEVQAHNRTIAETVAEEHGEVHGANAMALAEFMSNHYARAIESATDAEREEFRTDYFPRNAFPSDEQREVVDDSIEYTLAVAERTSSGGPR